MFISTSNPSAFHMTDIKIDENNSQNLNIIYKKDDLNLEKITYFKTFNHLNHGTDFHFLKFLTIFSSFTALNLFKF